MLRPEELERYHRFLVPDAKATFLGARVFLRTLLSSYGAISPANWEFAANQWGRPYIANPEAPEGLTFNLSHKPGMVTCLLGYGRDLGVDVEELNAHRPHLLEIAGRFFSPREAAGLRAMPAERQPGHFYELWTLKESYIKARGIGLSLGLSQFSFTVRGDSATIRFEPDFDDNASRWEFGLWRPDTSHIIAASVARIPDLPLSVEVRAWQRP